LHFLHSAFLFSLSPMPKYIYLVLNATMGVFKQHDNPKITFSDRKTKLIGRSLHFLCWDWSM